MRQASPTAVELLEQAMLALASAGSRAALPLFDQALSLDPQVRQGRSQGRVGRGLVLLDLGEFQRAQGDFQVRLEQDSQDAAAWLGLGRAQAGLGEHQAAIAAFDRALSLREVREGSGDVHWHRASSRAAIQDLSGAMEDLDAALVGLAPYARGTAREARICMARAQLRLLAEDRAGARSDFVHAAAVFDARGDDQGRDRVIAMARGLGL